MSFQIWKIYMTFFANFCSSHVHVVILVQQLAQFTF